MQVFVDVPAQVDRGLPFTFHALYRNVGGTTATGVEITATANGQSMTRVVGDVAPDGSGVVPFTAVAPDANRAELVLQAMVRATNDANPANDTDTKTTRTFLTYLVTNTNDSGGGSLRAAIDEANATCDAPSGESCKVAFRIPVAPAQWATIRPESPLPALTTTSYVIIDGSTQTRLADTNPDGPEIEINGSLLTSGNGITLATPCGSTVQDLAINGFPDNGVFIGGRECAARPGLGVRAVYRNYIGTDPTGTRAVPNLRGIFVSRDADPFISHTWITHNVVSGNRYSGIWVGNGSASILLNTIGLNAAVTAGLGNGSSGVYVGAAGSGTGLTDNYIGFNGHYGIAIDRAARVMATRNSIQANGNIGIDHGLDGVSPFVPAVRGNVVHAPVITSARYDAASNTTIIEGTLDVTGQGTRTFHVMLYANDARDDSGYGEGQYLLGQADPDTTGRFTFTHPGRTPGPWIAAIAGVTQFLGELEGAGTATSEFSRTVEVSQ